MSLLHKINEYFKKSIVDELLVFALIIAIIEQFAQNTLKKSKSTDSLYFLGIILYIMVGWILHFAYQNFNMSKLNVIWSCITIVASITLGYILYGETISIKKMLGALLAILAIWCVN